MRIAAIQMDVELGNLAVNLQRVVGKMQKAADAGVRLAVFPECVLTGYCFESREEAERFGREEHSPEIRQLLQAAGQLGISAAVGFLEKAAGKLYNAQVMVGPDGSLTTYRKVHLPGLGVDRFVDPGERPWPVARAADAQVGMAICYDSSFPETSRVLALAGADIIALSTNWPTAALRTSEIVPPARSMENHLYFVAANRIGKERGFAFCGRSSICGPDGVELARAAGDEEVMLVADVDLALARNKRIERTPGKHVIDRFADRRPEFYRPIAAPASET